MSHIEDALARRVSSLEPVQWAVLIGSLIVVVYSVAGLIANPSFAIAGAATSVTVLGVDMNGWHAVSGFLIGGPGLLAWTRRDWSFVIALVAGWGVIATGVWALIDAHPLGLLYLPAGGRDAILHFATGAIFIAGALHHYTHRS